jgi:hypothetical protein
MLILSTIIQFVLPAVSAQRLAAQPLSRVCYLVTILAGNLKPHSIDLSLSLGQVG